MWEMFYEARRYKYIVKDIIKLHVPYLCGLDGISQSVWEIRRNGEVMPTTVKFRREFLNA